MREIISLINDFWKWTGNAEYWSAQDVRTLPLDPLQYARFDELRSSCISLINQQLTSEEIDAFLLCMALDSEEEQILDACKTGANDAFLQVLVAAGVVCAQSEARWQMAELLRRRIPNRANFLDVLLKDKHPYVRQRAQNIVLYSDF